MVSLFPEFDINKLIVSFFFCQCFVLLLLVDFWWSVLSVLCYPACVFLYFFLFYIILTALRYDMSEF